jgi:hypothetical protein
LPEGGGGEGSLNIRPPTIAAPTMTKKGLTPIQNSAAAVAARTRFNGFFPISRPKVNVAFATMATTIT